jgi:hypothetical protein
MWQVIDRDVAGYTQPTLKSAEGVLKLDGLKLSSLTKSEINLAACRARVVEAVRAR